MVNSKNVAFKVDKQRPSQCEPPQPVGTIINCRKPTGKRAATREPTEVRTQTVPLSKFSTFSTGDGKRKREACDEKGQEGSSRFKQLKDIRSNSPLLEALPHLRSQIWQQTVLSTPLKKQYKPTKLRANRPLHRNIDLDCWYTILTFSEPSQLLQMREKIPSCFRFLRDSPSLWKHSRNSIYGDDLPDPPPGLTEFQYAHLRHGHGCMSCGASATRKTYWAFLRRWCKTCFHLKTIKEQDAIPHFQDAEGGDISVIIRACLPAGMVDSWGNFVGVGPASNHSLKTIYLLSDVQRLVQEYKDQYCANRATWHAEARTWTSEKLTYVHARTEFAQKMERWEEQTRNERSFDYQGRKEARKAYFASKAQQFNPPMSLQEMSKYPSYKRAIAIPKQPNMASWLQLKPKLEKERQEALATEHTMGMDMSLNIMIDTTPSLEGTPMIP